MQLRKTLWMLTALSAMSLVMTGCPEDGGDSVTCASETDCLESEICHPTAKACVTECTSSLDCDPSAKTCAAVSAADNRQVCQCSTDALCNTDRAEADLVCSNLDKVCVPKCTADTDCAAGRTCDVATGQCQAGGTGTSCTFGTCATGEVCNTTTNRCEQAPTCTGTAQGSCTYGQFCSAAGRCQDVPKPTCSNLEGKAVTNFTPTTGTGNIIYNVEKRTFELNSAECGTTSPAKVVPRIFFYTKDGTLPTTEEGLQGFFYVRTDKGEIALGPSNLFNYSRSADGKSATIDAFLCAPDVNQITLAFYFTGGNGYCTTFTK